MSATTGSFSIGNSTVQMPVKTGTLGPSVVDISKLYAQSGMFIYDPGFTSTASCESEITYIDGEKVCCSIAAIRSNRSPSMAISSRPAISCSMGNCRPPSRRRTSTTESPGTRWFTSRWPGSWAACAVTPTRWPLSAFYHDTTDISDPHQRMVASFRLIGPRIPLFGRLHELHQRPQLAPEARDLSWRLVR
jgi:citrate synthase